MTLLTRGPAVWVTILNLNILIAHDLPTSRWQQSCLQATIPSTSIPFRAMVSVKTPQEPNYELSSSSNHHKSKFHPYHYHNDSQTNLNSKYPQSTQSTYSKPCKYEVLRQTHWPTACPYMLSSSTWATLTHFPICIFKYYAINRMTIQRVHSTYWLDQVVRISTANAPKADRLHTPNNANTWRRSEAHNGKGSQRTSSSRLSLWLNCSLQFFQFLHSRNIPLLTIALSRLGTPSGKFWVCSQSVDITEKHAVKSMLKFDLIQ